MRTKVIEIYQSGKGYTANSKAGTPANHSESHYPQTAETLNSGEPCQEWQAKTLKTPRNSTSLCVHI